MLGFRLLLFIVSICCSSLPINLPPLHNKNAEDEQSLLFLPDEKPLAKDPKLLLAENQIPTPPPSLSAPAPTMSPGLTYVSKDEVKNEAKKTTQKADGKVKNAKQKFVDEEHALPRQLFRHQKIQDIESRAIMPPIFTLHKKGGTLTISGKYRPELIYARNTNLFNECDEFDRIFSIRHTIDMTLNAHCGPKKYDNKASELKFTMRNKGVWGNYASIAPTSESHIRDIDAKIGPHKHFIGRHVLWVREIWFKTLLNAALDIDAQTNHYLTIGYYPFKLGRGISLGDAYAVNPGALGFYTENVVDQYAPGIILGGEMIKDALDYDIYFAIFENRSDSLASNTEPIYTQRFGRRNDPERGFGSVNWLLAGRFKGIAFDNKEYGTLELQPYILYNHAPEQKIEFIGDGTSHLTTIGLDANYKNGDFECGFEAAKNLGSQDVYGWDRNQIITQLDPVTAAVLHVNSHVLNLDGTNALDIKSNQAIINSSTQSQGMNGQPISSTLVNASNRFSDPYCTPFKGWMAVADAGIWLWDRQLQVAVAAGIATGDENPNINLDDPKSTPGDGDFQGFIGLQEVYTGYRVESALFLGQRLPRPLSLPNDALEQGLFAATVNGFSNIIYAGTGLHVKPDWERKPYWRPNLLFFFQETQTHAFDCTTLQRSPADARSFLGTELNSFFNMTFADCVGATVVAAIFIPGGHYADIKGTPLNKDQVKLLLNETPDISSQLLLSTDPSFYLNLVLEYRF